MVGIRWKDWKTTPIFWFRIRANCPSGNALTSIPSMKTFPLDGRSIPARMPINVDLPEPEGPVNVSQEPTSTVNEIPLRIRSSRHSLRQVAVDVLNRDDGVMEHGILLYTSLMISSIGDGLKDEMGRKSEYLSV